MNITEHEMRGLLTGKCIPGDMKVNEQLSAYLVRKFSDLHEQLTATTNSLTNAQEALKSAGIEADTVLAGVMELVNRMNQLAAENAALKSAISYVCDTDNQPDYQYDGMGCGIEDRGIVDRYEAARYGWDEAIERMYGEVISFAEGAETPATDAYLNAVRAEGADAAAAKIRKAIPAFKDIHCGAVKECADIAEMVAAQLHAGNAGKDGA